MERQNQISDDDFLIMQQEAIRRVREMQNRARATLENAGMHIENSDEPPVSHSAADTGSEPDNGTAENSRTGSQYAVQPEAPRSGSGNQSNHNISYHAQHSNTQGIDTQGIDTHGTGARRSNTQRYDTKGTSAQHPGNVHGTGRPEERRSEHRDNPPVIHTPGINIDIESDQLMLLLTLYLLIKDGADKWLILSIAYVMLS